MNTRLLPVMFTLTGCLIMMASPVRAEQNDSIYLAADSTLVNAESNASHVMMPPTSLVVVNSELENTKRNAHDQGNTTLTPQDQKETKKDIKITAKIRRTVVGDKSLSVNAQNAKIITRNGVVTLRGPVASEAEKSELQQIAIQTQNVVQVDNQLENKAH